MSVYVKGAAEVGKAIMKYHYDFWQSLFFPNPGWEIWFKLDGWCSHNSLSQVEGSMPYRFHSRMSSPTSSYGHRLLAPVAAFLLLEIQLTSQDKNACVLSILRNFWQRFCSLGSKAIGPLFISHWLLDGALLGPYLLAKDIIMHYSAIRKHWNFCWSCQK